MGSQVGTAGSPILNVLERNNLSNVLIIVTRYFGGILLGTGGLVRAYTEAATKALSISTVVEELEGEEVEIKIDYPNFEKFKYYCNKNNIKIIKTEYNELITIILELTKQEEKKMLKDNSNVINILNFRIIRNKIIRKQ